MSSIPYIIHLHPSTHENPVKNHHKKGLVGRLVLSESYVYEPEPKRAFVVLVRPHVCGFLTVFLRWLGGERLRSFIVKGTDDGTCYSIVSSARNFFHAETFYCWGGRERERGKVSIYCFLLERV